jgi:hypothetical protein
VDPGGAGLAGVEGEGVAETDTTASAMAERMSLLNCIVSAVCCGCDSSGKGW